MLNNRVLFWIAVVIFVIAVLFAVTSSEEPRLQAQPATVEPVIVVDPFSIELPATPTIRAVRVDPPDPPTTTAAPFDPVAFVNGQQYGWTVWEPARLAWRVVMEVEFGWPVDKINAWEAFAQDVVMKESGGCPNAIGGDLFHVGSCDHSRYGSGSDSGFGQLISLWYRGGPLCVAYPNWLCSQASIIASPWASMVAFGFALDSQGAAPWCYREARGYHNCGLAP